jgi:ribosomal protein L36
VLRLAQRSLLRRLRTAPGAAALTTVALVGGALWLCGQAAADNTPLPPSTTTVDAPPPDPYHPAPAATTTKKTTVTRESASGARSAPVRTYSRPYSAPAAAPTVQRTVRASTPTRHRTAKVVRKQHRRHVVTKKPKPVTITLASVPELVTAVEAPLPPPDERGHPYLLGAGAAFALLALAGLSLHLLCVRSLRASVQ